MSGPKSSSYYVDLERQRQLMEQQRKERERREEERRVSVETGISNGRKAEISEKISEINALLDAIAAVRKKLKLEFKVDKSSNIREAFNKKIDECLGRIAQIGGTQNKNSQALKSDNAVLKSILNEIIKLSDEAETEYEKLNQEYYSLCDEMIKEGYNVSFSSDDITKIEKKRALEKERKIFRKVASGFDPDGLPDGYKSRFKKYKKIALEKTDASELKDYISTVVNPFIDETREYKKMINEFGPLYVTYCALADVYETDLENFEEYKTDSKSLKTGIELMKKKIAEMEKLELKERELAYIYDSLSEVVGELGYNLCGEIDVHKKKTGRIIHHQLYQSSEGYFMDVHYDDDGQISMRIGVGADCDRNPTKEEASRLATDMENFCGDYACIEAKLRARGINTERISELPPNEEYAQAINVCEFGAEINTSSEVETQKAEKKASEKVKTQEKAKKGSSKKEVVKRRKQKLQHREMSM